jgi:hypothetical protein
MIFINKILLTFYYIFWMIFFGSVYLHIIEKFYIYNIFFEPIIDLLTILVFFCNFIFLAILCYLRTEKKNYRRLIMLTIAPVLGLIPFFIFSKIPNGLEDTTHKIKVTYIAYGCECANWKLIEDNGIKCKENDCDDIFLEPINKKVAIPDTIGYNGDVIELTGKFYSKKGFPKYYHSEQQPEKARVFKYYDYKSIRSNHYASQKSLGGEKSDP